MSVKDSIQSMNEYDFEKFVADIWEINGWTTRVTSGSQDRGIDVIATRKGITTEKQAIQAKRYSEGNKVGSKIVRNYATLHQQERDIDSVVVVTTSTFTEEATKLGEDLHVRLVDGADLVRVISGLSESDKDAHETLQNVLEGTVRSTNNASQSGMRRYNEKDSLRENLLRHTDFIEYLIEHDKSSDILPEVLQFFELIAGAVESGKISQVEYSSRRVSLKNEIEHEKSRIRKLESLNPSPEFRETVSVFRKYLSMTSKLVTVSSRILNQDINEFGPEDIEQISKITDRLGELSDTLGDLLEQDMDSIQDIVDRQGQ